MLRREPEAGDGPTALRSVPEAFVLSFFIGPHKDSGSTGMAGLLRSEKGDGEGLSQLPGGTKTNAEIFTYIITSQTSAVVWWSH
jgi:hypothetical protein